MRCAAEADLRGVAAELLTERDRHRVHQVGAPGLDDVRELVRLGLQRCLQALQRGQQLRAHLAQRGQVHRRREHVVGGLAHVDVVVRVHAALGEVGDHLVRVHVRGGAGAGLEDVDRELVVVLAGRDLVARGRDALGDVGVEQAQLGVHPRGRGLDAPSHRITGTGTRSPDTGKLSTALRVSAPQSSSATVMPSSCRGVTPYSLLGGSGGGRCDQYETAQYFVSRYSSMPS